MSENSSNACIDNTTIINSPNNYYKLIALINAVSGAKQGWNLAKELKQYNISVYNLPDLSVNVTIRQSLSDELYKFKNNCIVLICGGDGTNTWATSVIDKCISTSSLSIPYPICVPIPMGTGNDLSRSLGWSNVSKQPNNKTIIHSISDILFASQIQQRFHNIDRWGITYTSNDTCKQTDQHLPHTFLCYLSIGYDAFITHKFEEERRTNPNKFKNQIKNQTVYIKHGLKELLKPSNPITDYIDIIIDNKLISLSNNCRSLKLININSAANGVFFWGKGKSKPNEYKQKYTPRLDDGIIEVMGTNGVANMLKCKTNISHAQRISQTNNIIIKFKKIPNIGIALQIDGEAFIINNKCSLNIKLHDKLTTVIGYNQPRGVQLRYNNSNNKSVQYKRIIKAKNIFRQSMKGILSSN